MGWASAQRWAVVCVSTGGLVAALWRCTGSETSAHDQASADGPSHRRFAWRGSAPGRRVAGAPLDGSVGDGASAGETACVDGYAIDPYNAPIAFANVLLTALSDESSGDVRILAELVTAADGSFVACAPLSALHTYVDVWGENGEWGRANVYPDEIVIVEVMEPARISGRVLGEHGQPISGATLTLETYQEPYETDEPDFGEDVTLEVAAERQVRSDAEGRFAIAMARNGLWTVRAAAEGYAPARFGPVTAIPGAEWRRDVQLTRGAELALRVLGGGVPIEGAAVRITSEGESRAEQTDMQGRVRVTGLPARDEYFVTIEAWGFAPRDVVLPAGTHDVDLVREVVLRVRVDVSPELADCAVDARVDVSVEGRDGRAEPVFGTQADWGVEQVVRGLPPGNTVVEARAAGASAVADLHTRPGEEHHVGLTLRRAPSEGVLTVRLRGHESASVAVQAPGQSAMFLEADRPQCVAVPSGTHALLSLDRLFRVVPAEVRIVGGGTVDLDLRIESNPIEPIWGTDPEAGSEEIHCFPPFTVGFHGEHIVVTSARAMPGRAFAGDRIVSVDGIRFESSDGLWAALEHFEPTPVRVGVERADGSSTVLVLPRECE